MLLHILCFSSFGAVLLGWSLLDRLGPMGVILPMVAAIDTCLSEIHRFLEPRYPGKGRVGQGLSRENNRASLSPGS